MHQLDAGEGGITVIVRVHEDRIAAGAAAAELRRRCGYHRRPQRHPPGEDRGMGPFHELFREIKRRYDTQPARDAELICAQGFHMNCDVLKLRKPAWTNDDASRINSPTGGIFFSIWVTEDGAKR